MWGIKEILMEANDEIDFDMDDDAENEQDDEQDDEQDTDDNTGFDMDLDGDDDGDDEESTDLDMDSMDGDDELPKIDDVSSDVVDAATENPNKQGVIRSVPGAELVYKRREGAGSETYEELWRFTIAKMQDAIKMRGAILSGTDIPVHNTQSPDGTQSVSTWNPGNVCLLHIKGLPN